MADVLPRLAEPILRDCHFWQGVEIETGPDFLRVSAWVQLETVEFSPPERRIVARAVMTTDGARELVRVLRKALARGGD